MLKELQKFFLLNGHTYVPGNEAKYRELYEWVEKVRESKQNLEKELVNDLDKIDFDWSTKYTSKDHRWLYMFHRLKRFKEQQGHTRVPSSWKEDPQLAKWVSHQRELEDTMPAFRVKMLNEIEFFWREDMRRFRERKWDSMFEELKLFYEENGHSIVPYHYKKSADLGLWVSKLRQKEKQLSEERLKKLELVEFQWSKDLKKKQREQWLEYYKELKEFYETHGHSKVPKGYEGNPSLANWVQRHRMREDDLEKWQIDRLNKIDFPWSAEIRKKKNLYWLQMFNRLKKYKKEFGHVNVPSKYETDAKLGRWVDVQRLYETQMEPWKKNKLDELGFQWSGDIQRAKKQRWYDMYDRLKKFYEKYGHSRVPEYWEEDIELSIWVMGQRRPKKPHSQERKKLLDSVDFAWNNQPRPNRTRDEKGRYISTLKNKKRKDQ